MRFERPHSRRSPRQGFRGSRNRGQDRCKKARRHHHPDKPKYGLHALRHAAASLFIEQGFSPKRVQALMGHSTIQMTFDTVRGICSRRKTATRPSMQQRQARLVG
jgi:integrase